MTSVEELKSKAERMLKYLELAAGTESVEIMERLNNLNIMVAQSGRCLADAKYYQDQVVNGAIHEAISKAYEERLSPSTINKFVTTAAKEYNYLVNLFDRINATAVHQIDSLRSILSYKKSEMLL
jgi:hypothetical protein